MGGRGTIDAGEELQVGAPATALPEPVELMLRDVVQSRDDVAFACVPLIRFPGASAERVLVVFLRAESDVEAALEALSSGVADGFAALAESHGVLIDESIAVMPVDLARPLDALAQAVVMTQTDLYVADTAAWQDARRGPQPFLLRWLRRLGVLPR
jgi:hypothetical protein